MQWSGLYYLGLVIIVLIVLGLLGAAINGHFARKHFEQVKDGGPPKPAPPIDPTKW